MTYRSFMIAIISLLIIASLLTSITGGFNNDNASYGMLVAYIQFGVIASFFLLGRYIYNSDSKGKRFFNGLTVFVILSIAFLAGSAYSTEGVSFTEIPDSLLYFYMYIAFPILAARPNRFLLEAVAKILKPF